MINTLKQLSNEICKPVLSGLKTTPKSIVLAHCYGKPSLMPAMYHVMGFDGKKLERVTNVNEEALKRFCVLLVRPFYHNLHVTIFVNRGKQWEKFGQITRRATEFEPIYRPLALKLLQTQKAWHAGIKQTGILELKPPVADVLPTMRASIQRFGCLLQEGDFQLGQFVLDTLDGMTRSGNLPTYVRAAMSVMHFVPEVQENVVTLTSDIEGATAHFRFEICDGVPPVQEYLKDNAKISDQLKEIRETPNDEYASFFDIVMLRALKNTLVIIPYTSVKAHSIKLVKEQRLMGDTIIEAYMVPTDGQLDNRYIHIEASIQVKNK